MSGPGNRSVVVVPTGTANLASVFSALRLAGAEPRLAEDGGDIERAARVVLPGVGSLGAAMEELRARDLVEPLQGRFLEERPLLCICLGLQLLAAESDESPGVRGLGVIPSRVVRLRGDAVRLPHIGWNRVVASTGDTVRDGAAYFAHSYHLECAPAGFSVARTAHGERFIAAIERGPQVACQFHPELSGAWGVALLERWLCR